MGYEIYVKEVYIINASYSIGTYMHICSYHIRTHPRYSKKPAEHTKIYLLIAASISHKDIQAKIYRPRVEILYSVCWHQNRNNKLE